MTKKLFVLCCALVLSLSCYADIELRFGVYSADKPSAVVRQFHPILDELEQSLSEELDEPVSISLQVASSYEKGMDDLISGKVDFSRFGSASYILSKSQLNELQILAVEDNDGVTSFNGVVCVGENSDMTSLAELRGKRFAFGDENSTIGRYLAQQALFSNGLRASDLGSYEYLGRHDKVGAAVASGLYEAGALKENTYNKLVAKGYELRKLTVLPGVPTKPWVAHPQLSGQLFNALQTVMFKLDAPEAFKALKFTGFVPADAANFQQVEEAILTNNRFFTPGIDVQ
ncbi:Phosphonate ABC transporter phosphate-binding periplasmic component [gamma proteobacterium IMCC2047]|nr:Phosphonate ABC transporter phosphate-binding periplasmic component [gamma proteobacterium IMCC2047]